MARTLYITLATLLAMAPVAPCASAIDQGFQIYLSTSQTGRMAGDEIVIRLDAFMWADRVDVDSVNISVRWANLPLEANRLSKGVYEARYTINASNEADGSVWFNAAPQVGALRDYATDYSLTGPSEASTGWKGYARALSGFAKDPSIPLSEPMRFQVRLYHNGTLADGPTPTCGMVRARIGYLVFPVKLGNGTVSHEDTGIYECEFATTATPTQSSAFFVQIAFASMPRAVDDLTFGFHPFPLLLTVSNYTQRSAQVDAYVGGNNPIAGATVNLSVYASGPFFADNDTHVERKGVSDARGHFGLTIEFQDLHELSAYAYVNYEGKEGVMTFDVDSDEIAIAPWVPEEPYSRDLAAALVSDPTSIRAGEDARLVYQVNYDGAPLVDTPLTAYLWRFWGDDSVVAYNVSTDGQGRIELQYPIPPDWEMPQVISLDLYDAAGEEAWTDLEILGDLRAYQDNRTESGAHIEVQAGSVQAGRTLKVTATYDGPAPGESYSAHASLVPGNVSGRMALVEGLARPTTSCTMVWSGTDFSCSIFIPAWYPGGEYTLAVAMDNSGATQTADEVAPQFESKVVQVEAGHWVPPDSGENLIPGGTMGSLLLIAVAGAAAAGAAIGIWAFLRRRPKP